MTRQLLFWILMLFWLAGSITGNRLGTWAPAGTSILLFVLLLILGWGEFGQPIKG